MSDKLNKTEQKSLAQDKEALLALLLEEEQEDIIERIDRKNIKLSSAQERIWFLEQLEPGNPLYNIHGALRLRGSLDVEAVNNAFNIIIERHELLRTVVNTVDGLPVILIKKHEKYLVPQVSIDKYDDNRKEEELEIISSKEARSVFDIEKGPLMRSMLVQISNVENMLLITFHHIIFDGWSLEIFFKEFAALYECFTTGKKIPLDSLPVQYVDFSHWQRRWLEGAEFEEQLAFWKKELDGSPVTLEFPTDRPRPPIQSFDGDRKRFIFPPELYKSFKKLASEMHVTMFMAILALFKVFLYRYSGQSDILVASPVVDRKLLETEDIIGLFVNNLVYRTDLSDNPSFITLLARIKDIAISVSENSALPFEKLVEALHPKRDRSQNPIFQVMFIYLNVSIKTVHLNDIELTLVEENNNGTSEFDLTFSVREAVNIEGQQYLSAWFDYSTALFDEKTIERIIENFLSLSDVVINNLDHPVDKLPILSLQEQKTINEWAEGSQKCHSEKLVHEMFEEQVKKRPDAVCVVCDDKHLTYSELDKQANMLSHYLRERGVVADSLVAVCLERNSDVLVGLLGILKAGGAYLPIDPKYPSHRISHMLKDSEAPIILTHKKFVDNLNEHEAETICLDSDWSEISKCSDTISSNSTKPNNLAYVIYTSGSTGKPKGVQIECRNMTNFIESMASYPGLNENDTFLAVTTISFDIHVLELFLPLVVGAKVVIASSSDAIDARKLHELLKENKVTVMQATPATWRMLLDFGWNYKLPLKVLCGGEALSSDLAEELLTKCDSLWNMYGPTETSVWSSVEEFKGGIVTVGRPIDNTNFYIVDSNFNRVPIGVSGELLIGGDGVVRGYLKRPELNNERFVISPFSDNKIDRLYRTGDMAHYLPDGRVVVSGRIDNQVKIRGYRVELGEIEAVINKHEDVAQSVAVVREDEPGDQRLVVYIISVDSTQPDVAALRMFLQSYLPEYMIPSAFVCLDSFPMTPNKKIDRKLLPIPTNTTTVNENFNEPQTEFEIIIAGIFQDVLKVDKVGRFDNFFDLGGHSLLAMKVVDLFGKTTNLHMQPGELFQQTVSQLASWHTQKSESSKQSNTIKDKLGKVLKFMRKKTL